MVQEIDCPQCGCNDVDHLATHQWWGKPVMSLKCNHCHSRWTSEMPTVEDVDQQTDAAFYPIVTCRNCGEKMKVASTKSEIRSMKCVQCGRTCKLPGKKVSV